MDATLDKPGLAPPATADAPEELVRVRRCRQAYMKESSAALVVLDDVELTLHSGEIVGLLGRSGSGKSTLLRIVSGLLTPTSGEVCWRGSPLVGPAPGVAMVFQSFALFPWLTVQANVELGLEAKGVARAERERLAEEAIELIGLGGYENAYPKELSGGMRQRVGLARALVVHPDLLLMDEPFSALDVLTAENLRTDLIELWSERKLPVKAILIVTHNIEESVLMCDRILVFSSNPGRVAHELIVPFPHPRNRHDLAFRQFVDRIYGLMTRRETPPPVDAAEATTATAAFSQSLPELPMNLMAGLMETLAEEPYRGRADLPLLAGALQLELDDLLPLGESLQMLKFAELEEGDIRLTPDGQSFVHGELDERKRILGASLMKNLPVVSVIRQVLDERWNHRARAERFRDELEDHMSPDYARQTLSTVISWGRYAELFDFDEEADQFFLDEEDG
ncbi:AAA-associated domain-containing protein [Lichenicola sp.]|uniref:ABC transporter ATP-binding protein n=1 Tax=Lichenicola sp. TaxID=2804529 RepID=UPI003B00A65C